MNIPLHEFELAAERLKPIVHHTALDPSTTFSRMTGGEIYLKCENRQKTGSFKIRGASNKIAAMIERGERCPSSPPLPEIMRRAWPTRQRCSASPRR